MAIGKELKRLRQNANLSVQRISSILNIGAERFRKWEERDTDPTDLTDIRKLEKFFGVKIKDLKDLKEIPVETINQMHEDPFPYITTGKTVDNALEKITHDTIINTAMLRVILRTQAEILSKQRGDAVIKVLSELSKAVKDETGEAVASL